MSLTPFIVAGRFRFAGAFVFTMTLLIATDREGAEALTVRFFGAAFLAGVGVFGFKPGAARSAVFFFGLATFALLAVVFFNFLLMLSSSSW